jgi:hypothetical protein
LASALAAEHDLDAVFHTLVQLTSADRCSLHILDRETGLLHGQVAHAAEGVDALVKKLVSALGASLVIAIAQSWATAG